MLRLIEEGDARFEVRRIGAPLLFGRLWEESGCRAVVSERLAGRGLGFDADRVVFAAVLHRLMVSGSDRSCAHWMTDYAIPGAEGLALHHFYRAMAWLGEEIEPAADGDLAPRSEKDLIEEALFARRRDLFSELGLVFMDTTSLSFEGASGETLGARGYSKDQRPDLKQMILAVVIDGAGRPVCTEILAGNTSDSTVLVPVVDRLRRRFGIGRVCVVADRGMISAATIAALEERGLEYILGTRERGEVRAVDGEPGVHHRHRVPAHAAGADGMKGRHRIGAEPRGELFVALHIAAGRELAAAKGGEGRLPDDVADHADARDRCPAIGFVLQIVGLDQRRRGGVGGVKTDPASALGVERAHAQAESVGVLDRRLLEGCRQVQVRRLLQRRHEVHLDVPGANRSARLLRKAPASWGKVVATPRPKSIPSATDRIILSTRSSR